jgi:chromosomal replication initiation ATPase DnaA
MVKTDHPHPQPPRTGKTHPDMARQLSFDLPVSVSRGADDFFVSPANADAFALIRQPESWPEGKLALIGPEGSGKSHLARVWEASGDVQLLEAARIEATIPVPASGTGFVIEDMEHLPPAAEEAVFHLHNQLAETGGRLLLTSAVPPARWPIALPDLASRMQATAMIRLGDPDDRLLAAVLTKLFADRQLSPAPEIIATLVARIERSFSAAARVVEALDDLSLTEGRDINRPLVRALLDKMSSETH